MSAKYVVFGSNLTRVFEIIPKSNVNIFSGKSMRSIDKITDSAITTIRLTAHGKSKPTVIMNFGNSDIMFTYFLKNLYTTIPANEYIAYCIEKYTAFLREIKNVCKALKCPLVVLGVCPPIIADQYMPTVLQTHFIQCRMNPPPDDVIKNYFEHSEDWTAPVRCELSKSMNDAIAMACKSLQIKFISVFSDMLDPNTHRIKQRYAQDYNPSLIHLDWKEYSKLVMKRLGIR